MFKTEYDIYRDTSTTVVLSHHKHFQLLKAVGSEYDIRTGPFFMCHKPDDAESEVVYIDEKVGYLMRGYTYGTGRVNCQEKLISLEALKLLQQYCQYEQAALLLAQYGQPPQGQSCATEGPI